MSAFSPAAGPLASRFEGEAPMDIAANITIGASGQQASSGRHASRNASIVSIDVVSRKLYKYLQVGDTS